MYFEYRNCECHHECPPTKVLRVETLSCLNVETESRTKWCGDGETEPAEPGIWRNIAHYGLSSESSQLINIETDPGTWRGIHL